MVRASDARSNAKPPSRVPLGIGQCRTVPNNINYKSTAAQQLVLKYKKAVETEDFRDIFAYIDSAENLHTLIDRVAPERCAAWNFQSLRSQCGTIEFRRPPQSTSAAESIHWICLSLTFVIWALTADFDVQSSLEDCTIFEETIRHVAEDVQIDQYLLDFEEVACSDVFV